MDTVRAHETGGVTLDLPSNSEENHVVEAKGASGLRWMRDCLRFAILVTVVFLLLACRQPAPPDDEIRVALNSQPLTMDPHYTNEVTSHIIHSNIFDTLAEINPDLTLSPALAARWNNPDDLTWVFDLTPNVRFQNGDPFTSQDVAFSILRAKNDPKSDWKGELVAVDRVETPTPGRVIVRTTHPYPILLNRISSIAIVPRKYVESHGPSILEEHPVGTGPYRFVSWDKKKGVLELERSRNYYKEQPELQKVSFLFVPDHDERVHGLLSGLIDLVTDTPLESSVLSKGGTDIKVLEVAGLREMFLAFDVKREHSPYVSTPTNPFLDRRVRLAFFQAINTRWIIDRILGGFAEEASQFGPPNVFGYDTRLVRPAFDLESAKKLMKEAGYQNGFSVTLDSPDNAYFCDSAVADYVAEALRAIHVAVKVNKMDKAALFQKETTHDTSFYMLSWSSGSGDIQEVFDYLLHTPDPDHGYGQDNGGIYSNPALDSLVSEASRTMDPGRRLVLLKKAVNMAIQDIPWVPLYVQADLYALNRRFLWDPPADRNIRISQVKRRVDKQ
jgi:peptide/nickel transport system substrate-binding protein